MKMLKLTRSHAFLGYSEVWINFDHVQSVFPIDQEPARSRIIMASDDGHYDVVETCEQIAHMANGFGR